MLKGRQITRSIVRSCVTCKRMEGPSYASASPPDLPVERVSEDPPFSHTGVDFAGPLFINDSRGQRDQQQEKVYVCLFTCAATRAVHLELTRDIGVETFLLSLRRFASRRGLPATIISDNAKTFKSSSKQIMKILQKYKDIFQKIASPGNLLWKGLLGGVGFGNALFKVSNAVLRSHLVDRF